MQQALLAEAPAASAERPLDGDVRCDVAIVGGGYTGLWTALRLKEAEPSLRVVVLEAGICGQGASGRNGGFATTWWHDLDALERHVGAEQARFLARASSDAIGEMETLCDEHGLDIHLRRGGKLVASAAPGQDGSWDAAVAAAERLGEAGRFEPLDGAAIRARIGSPVLRDGYFIADSASIQPALLARGLRTAALRLGVAVHEHTPMTGLDRAAARVQTPRGTVSADRVVLATNAWASSLPELRGVLVPLSSHMLVTAPIPERIEQLGWTGGEKLVDGRRLIHYLHVTRDGRIAFGRGGGAAGFRGRVGGRVIWDERLARTVVADFRRFFPQLADVRIEAAWGGAVDRSWRHLPFFAPLPGADRVLVGAGYSGDGVIPAVVGGRVLASLALGRGDAWATCGMTTVPDHRQMPPEPFRKVGAEAIRALIARNEALEERGGRPGALARRTAGLAWLTLPARRSGATQVSDPGERAL
ncbi:FAD dependent oxidoreductase [Conexibacter woesei DSM 14684]|uniref:FAD dependent oxidoreductase n=2 Tax=Conexibacter TaxID=191494 RepID=D3FAH6_CONWI|nr:FAD dependent oxidoreductase [Conexibacter woesei DSM 14684]